MLLLLTYLVDILSLANQKPERTLSKGDVELRWGRHVVRRVAAASTTTIPSSVVLVIPEV